MLILRSRKKEIYFQCFLCWNLSIVNNNYVMKKQKIVDTLWTCKMPIFDHSKKNMSLWTWFFLAGRNSEDQNDKKNWKMTIVSRKIMNITWYFTQSIVLGHYVIQYIWKVKFVSTYWENIPFVFLNIVVDRINLDGCTIAYVLLQSM